jgi:hypothetical protein
MVGAISFELSKCDDEIVVNNMIKRLNDIDFDLAKVPPRITSNNRPWH